LERAECRDRREYAIVTLAQALAAATDPGDAGGLLVRSDTIRGSFGAERRDMVALSSRGDARRDKLDIMEVHDVEVLRVQALERAAHAAAQRVGRVVKVRVAVSPHFGIELIGATRELGLEGFEGRAKHDLRVIVIRCSVEGADAVSVCACVFWSGRGMGDGMVLYRRASRMVRSGTSVTSLSSSL
jgi:hypothetical protein